MEWKTYHFKLIPQEYKTTLLAIGHIKQAFRTLN